MVQAQVYYYPSGLGHIGVNIIFSKDETPDYSGRFKVTLWDENNSDFSSSPFEDNNSYNRVRHIPTLISKGNGDYSIYGYNDHCWKETPLNNLTPEERAWLESLDFRNDSPIKPPISLHPLIQKGHPDITRREFFFDWGGTFDYDENIYNRGSVLRINLPPTKTSRTDFFEAAEKLRRAVLYNDDNYDLFNNNCAHSVLDLLYCAGYISEKPDSSFDLFPIVAATKASKLANELRPAFRKQLLDHKEQHNETQLINSLIQLSIDRLEENIHLNYGNHIGECEPELKRLLNIHFDGSSESIERLLQASEMATPHTLKELENCLALVEPKQCFSSCIARLEAISKQLKNRESTDELQQIATLLHQEFVNFQNKNISHQQFRKNCSAWIEKATPILEGESSFFLQVLQNIAIAVCSLIVFYLVAAFINQSNSGNFLFFNEPSLSRVTLEMQRSIDKLNEVPDEVVTSAVNL